MNKKILLLTAILILFVGILFVQILRYRAEKPSFIETIPLFARPTPSVARTVVPPDTVIPGIPKQTDLETVAKQVESKLSKVEKNKIFDALPIRIENFSTSVSLKTTINVYNLLDDPEDAIRLEIYGVNYNNPGIQGKDATAFRESFLEAKKYFTRYRVNLKSLQIVYGNRQYIQDTATYWVKTFKLLD